MTVTESPESQHNSSRNILAIIGQVLVSGVVLFVLYRYLYDQLGVEQIGIWSLVASITSITKVGDLGLSSGVVKFVAQSLGRRDLDRAADIIQTVALTLAFLLAALVLLVYPLFTAILKFFLPAQAVSSALDILPYALASLWALVIGSVFTGGLDGCLRMDLRSLLIGSLYIVYLVLAVFLVPQYGLRGVVISQVVQSFSLLILSWFILRGQLKNLPLYPQRWNFLVLKEMFSYGTKIQITAVMNMLFDPVVKALMTKFGSLEALGYYGMANSFILQGRALIVEASRVMVATVATLQERDSTQVKQLFITSYRMTFYVSTLFYGLLGVFITPFSMIWLGHYQVMFIQFALLMVVGWFINTLIGPAYFSNQGTGRLKDNVLSDAIQGLGSLFLGTILGFTFGANGVVFGTVISLIFGSLFLLFSHIQRVGLRWTIFIVPQEMILLLVLAFGAPFLSNYYSNLHPLVVVSLVISLLCSLPLLFAGWFHPMRKMLLSKGKI